MKRRGAAPTPRPRSIFPGDTDYTAVPLNDILDHLRGWHTELTNAVVRLGNIRGRLEALDPAAGVSDGLEYLDGFRDLFERYAGDFERLIVELPSGVLARHVSIVRQMYESSRSEEQLCVAFKQQHYLDALHPAAHVRNTLAEIYALTRDVIIDLRDLGNVVHRLETYVGHERLAEEHSSSSVNALELKPNFMGVGVNLNYVWHRWGLPHWTRWRRRHSR